MKVLDLYITKVCNLDCEYCYVDVVKQEKQAFQVEDFLERVDLLKYDTIKFFGGEPLVRWEMIQKIVESVSEKNVDIDFVIVTNGILLNEEKIQYIVNHQKIDVVISIHEGSFPQLKNKLSLLGTLKNQVGFYIIFDPSDFSQALRKFIYFVSHGFKSFCFAPEIYGDWSDENLLQLKKLLEKLTAFIQKFQINISGISHNTLKEMNRGCEKTVYNEAGKFVMCNRFKALSLKEKFNYTRVYDFFDTEIGFQDDPYRWFYICPVGWYLDNETKDLNASVQTFKKLNYAFIDFYKKIHSHHLSFFSENIEEIRFNLTQQCNIRCKYCYVDFKNKVLDLEEGKNIIDFFIEQSGKNKKISFFGGEPLLEFQRLKDLVLYAQKKAEKHCKTLSFSVATNFMLINQEKIYFLQEHNISLHISLNGDIQTNDILRDGSSQRVLHNIKKFLSLEQKKKVCILFAFGPKNVPNISKNLEFLIAEGFQEFNMELIFGTSYQWKKSHIYSIVSQMKQIKDTYSYITFQNIIGKGRFLDISTDGTCGENSLEFYNNSVDTSIKNMFDTVVRALL